MEQKSFLSLLSMRLLIMERMERRMGRGEGSRVAA
jgi:hypothetical protein